jgi:hypothetical protein
VRSCARSCARAPIDRPVRSCHVDDGAAGEQHPAPIQVPGTAARFYWDASEPAGDGEGPVDFDRIGQVAQATGATTVLGPPPFTH